MKVASESAERTRGDTRETWRADRENGFRKTQLLFHFTQWGSMGVLEWPLRHEDRVPYRVSRRWSDTPTTISDSMTSV